MTTIPYVTPKGGLRAAILRAYPTIHEAARRSSIDTVRMYGYVKQNKMPATEYATLQQSALTPMPDPAQVTQVQAFRVHKSARPRLRGRTAPTPSIAARVAELERENARLTEQLAQVRRLVGG